MSPYTYCQHYPHHWRQQHRKHHNYAKNHPCACNAQVSGAQRKTVSKVSMMCTEQRLLDASTCGHLVPESPDSAIAFLTGRGSERRLAVVWRSSLVASAAKGRCAAASEGHSPTQTVADQLGRRCLDAAVTPEDDGGTLGARDEHFVPLFDRLLCADAQRHSGA